jgi:hypothetical protein
MDAFRRWGAVVCAVVLGPLVPAIAVADPPPKLDPGTYEVELRAIEKGVNEIKEQIRKRQTALALLSETMFGGLEAPARAEITVDNDMSIFFKLNRVIVLFDGTPLALKTEERDGVSAQKTIPIYRDLVLPGDHTVQVVLDFKGNGDGVFSYLSGYRFAVRTSRSFTAQPGKTLQLHIVAFEQGGPTTPFEDRPAIRFVEKTIAGVAPTP